MWGALFDNISAMIALLDSRFQFDKRRQLFHPHAQRNIFRHRGARRRSRLFDRLNQSLRRSPNGIRL